MFVTRVVEVKGSSEAISVWGDIQPGNVMMATCSCGKYQSPHGKTESWVLRQAMTHAQQTHVTS